MITMAQRSVSIGQVFRVRAVGEAVKKITTVIFACTHDVGLSQMAAAFFNDLANPAQAKAIAAGMEPSAEILPEVIRAMRETGVDLSLARPQLLTRELAMLADRIVTLGPPIDGASLPNLPCDEWPTDDPQTLPAEGVRELRDRIRSRVWKLLAEEGWFAKQPGEFGLTPRETANSSAKSLHPPAAGTGVVDAAPQSSGTVMPELVTPPPGGVALEVVAEVSASGTETPENHDIQAVEGDVPPKG
jgi:arsenate reductase